MKKRIRMVDIASSLGIGKSTVSMALSGHPDISAATQARVKAEAERLGYVPDPALRYLTAQRWSEHDLQCPLSIGFVVWDADDYVPQQLLMKKALRAVVKSMGYGFEFLVVKRSPNVAAAVRVLKARGVVGVVAFASADQKAWEGFPLADFSGVEVMSGGGAVAGYSVIRPDAFGTMLSAGELIVGAGVKSAAICLLGQHAPSITDLRMEAAAFYVEKLWSDAGMTVVPAETFSVSLFAEGDQLVQGILKWLKETKPAAVILPNSGIAQQMVLMGVRVPEEMRMITIQRQNKSDFAGFEMDHQAIAWRAVHDLDSLLRSDTQGPEVRPVVSVIPKPWRDGLSF